MTSKKPKNCEYRIFFSAAEASADRICAQLAIELQARGRESGINFTLTAIGGDRMADSGCEIIINTAHNSAMIYKAFAEVWFFWRAIRKSQSYFKQNKPDMVIVCDSPSFNFHIAKSAAKYGIKTLFYVAPQLWAWAPWRIDKLKKLATAGLAAVLPFEPDWFARHGLDCKFVGSPMLEAIVSGKITAKTYRDYDVNNAHIAILPGSRRAELKSLWPAMQNIARRLKARRLNTKYTVVAADEKAKISLQQTADKALKFEYAIDAVYDTACRCDFAIVASGSATLQVAAAACPMTIMYQSNKYLWHLVGRHIVKTKYLSLVNILAQKELVPEFMPYFNSVAPIAAVCEDYLTEPAKMSQLSSDLVQLTEPLVKENAARNVADMIFTQLGIDN